MSDVIPTRSSAHSAQPSIVWLWVLAALLAVMAAGATIWLGLSWSQLLPAVRVLGVGLVAIGAMLIAALFIVMRLGGGNDRRSERRDGLYSQAFFETTRPQLITKGGKPALANRAYLAMAKQLDVDVLGDLPPAVDRLFSTLDKDGSAAIFRLYHLEADTMRAEEELDVLLPNGSRGRYRLCVARLGEAAATADDALLWQVDAVTTRPDRTASLAQAPIGLFSVTRDGRVLSINKTMERWLGGPEALTPAHMSEFIDDPDVLLGADAANGKTVRADTRLITRKGVVTPTVMIARWSATDAGELVATVALHGHTSRPKVDDRGHASATAQTAAQTASQGSTAFESVPFGVLNIDGATIETAIVSYANSAFQTLSGRTDPVGRPFADLFEGQSLSAKLSGRSHADMAGLGAIDITLSGPRAVPVALYVVPDPVVPERLWAYLIDISARKSLEDQIRQSQKMQAVGQLTAGVAHDFNNLLTAIRLNTDELLQRHPVGDPSYPELQNINATGARAAALVKKLLAFSRQQTRRAERIDVSEALSDMYLTLKQTLGGQAQLELTHARDLPPVMVDRSQFDNVVMNLCVNARDAMEAQGGGTITIASERIDRRSVTDRGLQSALLEFPSDDIVLIRVSDTGTGMSDAVKAKIFEPFFTTKDQGKGTGLGLATVYGVIQQSGGHLAVDSELGRGTTFQIYLPAASQTADTDQAPAQAAAPPERKPADLAGQGNILFVEDESAVRVIAAKSLRKRGYHVIEAEDGEEALEILEDATEAFDLLLSDVVMPGLDGPGLLKQGRALLGDARIVFISGYAAEKFSDLLAEEPDVTFLPKPFTLAELAEKVKSEIGDAQ
ncbi:ATP-binding protein [Algimonas porphyrae]|uniref:histidine kinase n=1 Tax=Algimonas porphyrae TaxID=1128113 RepID=A0ABQ5V2I0_9PROT|nr:PAS domain-containing hybrid sensor histidine kinase/response regulator [Algimonas porphyrae]GLQ21750.1 hypothetical protein GCM10007854_27050 [Algimonas porphyrae]